jgi:hypothetical protein
MLSPAFKRALQLAHSGRFGEPGEIRKQLRIEGFTDKALNIDIDTFAMRAAISQAMSAVMRRPPFPWIFK